MHLARNNLQQPTPLLVSRRTALDLLQVGGTMLDRLIAAGALEAVRINTRVMVSMASIEAFAKTGADIRPKISKSAEIELRPE